MRTRPAARSFGHLEVFAALFALSFLAARLLPLLSVPYVCPFRALTGIPCPTCGTTHAAVALLRGDVGGALAANPLATAAGIAFGAAIAAAFGHLGHLGR